MDVCDNTNGLSTCAMCFEWENIDVCTAFTVYTGGKRVRLCLRVLKGITHFVSANFSCSR